MLLIDCGWGSSGERGGEFLGYFYNIVYLNNNEEQEEEEEES